MTDMTDVVFQQSPPDRAVYQPPGGGQVTVRNLTNTRDDAEFAGRLIVEAFKDKILNVAGRRNVKAMERNCVASCLGNSAKFYGRHFVAESEGRRAGLLIVKFHGDPHGNSDEGLGGVGCCALCKMICFDCLTNESVPRGKCYIETICVDEGFRGKGVGKVLMEFADNEARKRNCNMVYLAVTTNNRAVHLYQRQGFEITNTSRCCGFYQWLMGVPSIFTMEKTLRYH